MTTLVLSIGIAVTFLTVWGVIMVGAYLIGREPSDATPPAVVHVKATEIRADSDLSQLG